MHLFALSPKAHDEDGLMGMANIPIFILLFLCSFCKSDDRLTHAKPLAPGDMLISQGGDFALGFFSPANSNTSLYLGIWYHSIPGRTVVWVANRDDPITIPSSAMLAVTDSSGMVLSNSKGQRIWTATSNVVTAEGTGAYAVLLDTGNLVLRSPNDTDIWQSFDHPTDTILPTMRFLVSYKDKVGARLVAWKGPDDPSSGDFSCSSDPSSPELQIFIWYNAKPYSRVTTWNGATMTGGRYLTNTSSIIYQTAIHIGEAFYFFFTLSDRSAITHIRLDYTGKLWSLIWNHDTASWTVISELPADACDLYAPCGPFSYCELIGTVPTCHCLDGFEPIGLNFSSGCRRREQLICGGQSRFVTLPVMKVPDKFLHIRNKSFDQCGVECNRNCSCTAYAYANLSNGGTMADMTRCLLWSGELIDFGKAIDDLGTNDILGENLYLRLADSPVDRKNSLVKILLPIIAGLLLLTCTTLVWICKYRAGKRRKKEIQKKLMIGYLNTSNEFESENVDFPFVGFEDILSATDAFAESNLLGRGGFGKVYKGILEGGNEVAIKRLSKGSGQGIEEFRNELILIAKLQHRNLVRLLGCCIHEDEKLLIYEYVPNKSLDAFLFDTLRKHMLDWFTRFKIIKGVARGLLYLHQDSRLTIIHRDIKASNILLDTDMTPKIADFGLARIFGGNHQKENTNRVVGTYGYMPPEYVMGGVFSVKSDIYSFGVLLLEIASGLKISSPRLTMNFSSLTAYAWRLWEDGKSIELVDSSVIDSCSLQQVLRCIHIGLLCVQDHPIDRPFMSSVIFMFENESVPLAEPKQPLFFAQRNCETEEIRENKENSINTMSITTLEGR